MYQELLSNGEYDNAVEYNVIHALAQAEREEEIAREEYEQELSQNFTN